MLLTFRHRIHLAGNAWAYEFTPDQPLAWKAGQFIRVELPHPHPDEEGTRRDFTIAAAPHEGIIRIATRHTDSTFKQALHELTPGESMDLLDLPAGDFVWHEHARPLIFVAQGIGITPFYAMLLDRAHRGLPLRARLFYANRVAEVPFLEQLLVWEDQGLTLELSDEPYTSEMLADRVPNLAAHLVYASGPKSLITLLGPPINLPPKQLLRDVFPNYPSSAY